LAELRREGLAAQTSNHYLRAIKQFARWLVRDGRMEGNPLAELRTINVETDQRHDRRALSPREFALLVESASNGPAIETITGADRAMMYVLSAWTGYRTGEIGSLKRRSFELDAEPATVTVEAAYWRSASKTGPGREGDRRGKWTHQSNLRKLVLDKEYRALRREGCSRWTNTRGYDVRNVTG
jgi:site-specific recombinase XerC